MKNTKFEDNLIYLFQGFGTSIFLNVKKGKLESYATSISDYLYKDSMSSEEKKIMIKLFKLYGKLPKNYSNINKVTEEQLERILSNRYKSPGSCVRSEIYTRNIYKFATENIGTGVQYDEQSCLRLIYDYVLDTMEDQYNKYIGSSFKSSKMQEIEHIIRESETKGVYVLKKYYKSEKRKINKRGLDYVLKV